MDYVFDADTCIDTIVSIIKDNVGDELGFLITPSGEITTEPAVFVANQNIPEPQLTFISVDFLASNDRFGHTLDAGVIEEEDEAGDPIFYPYRDTYIEYLVRIRCEGEGGQRILRKIRNVFLLDVTRTTLEDNCWSTVQLINTITSLPSLIETNYRDISTLDITFNTFDRYIDRSSTVIDTIDITGALAENVDDTSPLDSSQVVDVSGD